MHFRTEPVRILTNDLKMNDSAYCIGSYGKENEVTFISYHSEIFGSLSHKLILQISHTKLVGEEFL